jgi:integrase
MAKAEKLPSGRWRCKAYFTDEVGKHTSKSFMGDSKKEAEGLAAIFLLDRKHDSKLENTTLAKLADKFIENRSNILSPSTIATYRKLRRIAFQDIINVRIGLLTKELYQKAINEYSKVRSYKTVISAHTFYKQLLLENGIHIADKVNLPQKDGSEMSIPTNQELSEFLNQIKDSRIYHYVLLPVYLGLRRSEVIALKWKDIDFVNKRIRICRARVQDDSRQWVEKSTKTFSGKRLIDAPQDLLDLLEPFIGEPEEYVIENNPSALESLYKRESKKAHFHYNYHSLRHYHASILLANGIPNKYAMERMGHKTANMLNKVYQHTMPEFEKEFNEKVEVFFKENIEI